MSGHSKWHNIQAKKGKADAARGKIFTKLGREILIAVKQGGPDPAGNSKLKDVISKCKANNMPNDTINNAIKKASGATDTSNYEEITYEGYGTNGVAVIVEASTDNRNRTAADVRHVFDKAGGNLGTTGCVSYLFNKKGIIVIDKESFGSMNVYISYLVIVLFLFHHIFQEYSYQFLLLSLIFLYLLLLFYQALIFLPYYL